VLLSGCGSLFALAFCEHLGHLKLQVVPQFVTGKKLNGLRRIGFGLLPNCPLITSIAIC
jgi:hypothetical protein